MGPSLEPASDSSEIAVNLKEQSSFDASPDSHTDPAQDNSSEEYTDSDDDPNPGLAAGGSYTIDFENAPPDVVQKAREGIQLAIDDFNHKNGTNYELVEIQKVARSVCYGLALTLVFVGKPADSVDNLLTEFEAFVGFAYPDYELKYVECEAKSTKRATEVAIDTSCSKRQRGVSGSPQAPSDAEKI